jgi:hypothetical protein
MQCKHFAVRSVRVLLCNVWVFAVILIAWIVGCFILYAHVQRRYVVAVAHIDRRKPGSEKAQYYVLLYGKQTSLAGHVYVTWAEDDPNGGPAPKGQSVGFYGLTEGGDHEMQVSFTGKLDEDDSLRRFASGDFVPVVLVIWLEKEEYERSRKVIEQWRGRGYKLFESDCVSFMEDVAKSLHLNTPQRFLAPSPVWFVRALIDANWEECDEAFERYAREHP